MTTYVPKVVPQDAGFAQSFSLDDLEGARLFFDEFGFVVVDDVLSTDECEWPNGLTLPPECERLRLVADDYE
jgi:hypothetical protein